MKRRMISGTDDLKERNQASFEKASWAGIQQEQAFPAERNTRAFVPREGRFELDAFDGVATAACARLCRDDGVLGRSGPGGGNPPEVLAFGAFSISFQQSKILLTYNTLKVTLISLTQNVL